MTSSVTTGFMPVLGHTCNQQHHWCLRSFTIFKNQTIFPFFNHNNDLLLDFCRNLSEMDSCMQKMDIACMNNKQRLLHQQSNNTLNFLCNGGYIEYTRHKDCLFLDSLQTHGDACYRSYSASLLEVNSLQQFTPLRIIQQTMCSQIHELITCLTSQVMSHCGEEAAGFIQRLKTTFYEPMTMNFLKCQNQTVLPEESSSSNYNPSTPILVVFATVFLVAIFLIIAFIVQHRHRRRKFPYGRPVGRCASGGSGARPGGGRLDIVRSSLIAAERSQSGTEYSPQRLGAGTGARTGAGAGVGRGTSALAGNGNGAEVKPVRVGDRRSTSSRFSDITTSLMVSDVGKGVQMEMMPSPARSTNSSETCLL